MRRQTLPLCALLLLAAACRSDGGTTPNAAALLEPVEPAWSDARPAPDANAWSFELRAPDGSVLRLDAHDVGRGGWSIAALPANTFASDLNVVSPRWSSTPPLLAFEHVPVGHEDWQIGLAQWNDGCFEVVATSDYASAAWADWAVVSPDGTTVAAWVFADEHALHLLERDGDRLVVVERRHAEAIKAFPSFAPNGRLAARLPLHGEVLRYANSIDGVLGPTLDAVREVRFDARGDRWAYAGRRAAGWFVFAGTGSTHATESGPFDDVGALEFPSGSAIRARVQDAGAWRWVMLDGR